MLLKKMKKTCAGGFVQIPAALTRQAGGSHLSQGRILSSDHGTVASSGGPLLR
jgi:hypothetical protein